MQIKSRHRHRTQTSTQQHLKGGNPNHTDDSKLNRKNSRTNTRQNLNQTTTSWLQDHRPIRCPTQSRDRLAKKLQRPTSKNKTPLRHYFCTKIVRHKEPLPLLWC